MLPADPAEKERRRAVVAVAVAVEAGLGLIAALVGMATGYLPWATLRWSFKSAGLGVAAAGPMLAAFLFLWHAPHRALATVRGELERRVIPLFRGCTLAEIAAVCVAAGIGEELLFRGLVQGGLTPTLG
ncbi:MAG: hypothetical protein D6815_09725, partial [Candidatus Dadabacteria bacterium]